MLSDLFIKSISVNFDNIPKNNYLYKIPMLKNFYKTNPLAFNKKVTFIVGENGTGKSTLLEAIAVKCGFNAEGGTKNFYFSTFSSHSDLHKFITLTKGYKNPTDGFFLRAESFYNVASQIENLNAPGRPPLNTFYGGNLHEKSHGESFLSLMINRFQGNGLYILDEPEAALSPSRLLSMLNIIDDLVKTNSQFIIATHSPILMAYPDADIYLIEDENIKAVKYKETSHYIITKDFINNPEKMLKHLLNN